METIFSIITGLCLIHAIFENEVFAGQTGLSN
jgi:hypothetical protein